MSTRSRIGVLRSKNGADSTVESVYCHFDGYPSGVGAKLRDHWTDPGKLDRLIKRGDLSTLGSEIGNKHDFNGHTQAMQEHGLDWCLFYERDRGEEDVGAKLHPVTAWPSYGQEYEYLFDPEDRSWRCRPVSIRDDQPGESMPLAEAIASDEAAMAAARA